MTRELFPDSPGPGVTVLEYIQAHLDPSGCGLMPEAGDLPGTARDGEIRWMPGAADGVGIHHGGRGRPEAIVDEIVKLMGQVISGRFSPATFGALYERLRVSSALSYVDDLARAVSRSALPRSGVHEIGRRIAMTGRHPEPVKVGIALLGISGSGEDADLLLTLGRHEELTLYCAVALANSSPDPESALWSLARSVEGWGRIQTVERLKKTERDDIQDWLVRDGFRNQVMDEYLAYIAATTGKLLDRLGRPDPDQDLVHAARDIVTALIRGGPAEDIDDYPGAPELLSLLVTVMTIRAASLEDFNAIDSVAWFLRDDDGWDERYQRGWTSQQRQEVLTACERILSRPEWPERAAAGLQADDDRAFWAASRAARVLGIDTFDAHWRRLAADPLNASGGWYAVMQLADEQRITRIVALAEQELPLEAIAAGPAMTHVGIGPEFAAEDALDLILQDLGRFPGHGWNLVRAGLESQVIRVRNMATRTLSAWPRTAWPAAAAGALEKAAQAEPNEETRVFMNQALAGEAITELPGKRLGASGTPVITERRRLDDHGTCACLASRHAGAPQITPVRAGSKRSWRLGTHGGGWPRIPQRSRNREPREACSAEQVAGAWIDVVAILDALAEQGVTALLKADGERMRAHIGPLTFAAGGAPPGEDFVRIDAASVEGLPRVCGSPPAFARSDGARVR